jgi:hypothetical protein
MKTVTEKELLEAINKGIESLDADGLAFVASHLLGVECEHNGDDYDVKAGEGYSGAFGNLRGKKADGELSSGQIYYLPNIFEPSDPDRRNWEFDDFDYAYLDVGLICLTKEEAIEKGARAQKLITNKND